MLQIERKRAGARRDIPDFTNPLALLVHCHARIEDRLAALERAVESLRETGDRSAEAVQAVLAARDHFAGPGVKHTADEEDSLFPRMRARRAALTAEVESALALLEAQHRVADRVHAALDALADRAGEEFLPTPAGVDRLGAVVGELTSLYRPHIRLENEVIYPAAGRILPADELLAVGAEMRERREDMFGEGNRR